VELPDAQPIEHAGETIYPRSRTFIPARLEDNPHLNGSDYRGVLQGLHEPLRSQLLFGDFGVGLEDDPYQIIPTEWVRIAQERWEPAYPSHHPMDAVGVDVARGGKDKTVISPRWGAWFAPLQKHEGKATPDGQAVAQLTLAACGEHEPVVNVDVIGVGSSAYDWLFATIGDRARAINVAAATDATDRSGNLRFINVRAAAWWAFREALDPQTGDNLALPPDPELLADLTAVKWKLGLRGIQAESKEDLIKRLGRSPDCGDAIVLAAWLPPQPIPDQIVTMHEVLPEIEHAVDLGDY